MPIDFATHPLGVKCRTYPVWSDTYKNIERQVREYESVFDDLAEMTPGDPDAYSLLKDQASRLAAIVQACGPIHGWLLAQHARLFAEACRLRPAGHEFTRPNWTEP